MQRLVMFALVAVLILPFAGCLGENESNTTASTRTLDVEWTEIPLETKSEYYSDEEAVSWQLSSDLVEEDIQNAGGIIVGISMLLDYPNEDESPNVGLCTGLEDNVEDIIYGTLSKNDWTLTQNDVNPGSHVVNLTWHNQSLLEMENISGMSDDEIMRQIDFGMDAYGAYDITIMVDADAFNGNFCTHTDNGEQVSSSISLLVLDVTIEGGSDVSALSVGDGTVSIVLFLPWFVGITVLLLQNYSPLLVGAAGCAAVVAASLLRSHTRIGFAEIVAGLRQGALLAVPISVACAVAGIVVGTIGQTGIGLQFTESVVSLSDGRLWLALILVAVAALVLGMGLPATAAYIVLAVMTGPALQELGLALITAHMIIFWLAQSSNVTPPIALAAFAGAGIAGAQPMASAVSALKLANGLFVIPLMMAYSPLLLTEAQGWPVVLLAGGVTLLLIVVLAMALEGFLWTTVPKYLRVAGLVCAGLLVWPDTLVRIVGAVLALFLFAVNWLQASRSH